ncbi:MAG TPA: GntR family transcriptional regulator [Solirubrobacteraceae bacterium]
MPERVTRTRGSTRPQVYGALREAIVSTRFEPGRQLSENELAEWLGVSRTPVREALVRLSDERLVEIVPQLGTFVSRISVAAVADAQFVREALECAAVRLAAERATREDINALKAIVARQAQVEDFDRWYVLDDELHAALFGMSGHSSAWSLAERAEAHLNRVRRLSLPQPRYMREMVAEHRLVIRAIERGDADAAEEALRHHLRMVLSGLDDLRAQHPDYFEEI